MFEIAAETLITIAADPKHLGAQVGATLVLHTWGSALTHHPHVHGIVPGGGLSPDGKRWVSCKLGFFLSVRVLSRLFRRRFLQALEEAHRAARLQFFGDSAGLADPKAFARWVTPLRKIEWVVYAKRPFAGPEAVLAYLSRYTTRFAVAFHANSGRNLRDLRAVRTYCGKTVELRCVPKMAKLLTSQLQQLLVASGNHELLAAFRRVLQAGY